MAKTLTVTFGTRTGSGSEWSSAPKTYGYSNPFRKKKAKPLEYWEPYDYPPKRGDTWEPWNPYLPHEPSQWGEWWHEPKREEATPVRPDPEPKPRPKPKKAKPKPKKAAPEAPDEPMKKRKYDL